jgi:hypothetical protein
MREPATMPKPTVEAGRGFSPVNSPRAQIGPVAARTPARTSTKKMQICRGFVMGTAGLEPATSRV